MRFGATRAVKSLSLDVRQGEFFSILGPSGCGKTTLLRLISGFQQPTAGQVLINGTDMAGVPSNMRATAMIFQSLALFPFMRVWENIAFGLEARGVGTAERRREAERLLELIALPGYGNRMPGELSGGQRQRVAIARALAIQPQVLLLDEPLSALDLKLRQHMRAELRDLQKRTGVTFIYITHDQSEALAMSDRVAVMNAGQLQQVGSPQELYSHPATSFVAQFVGENNALMGTVTEVSGGTAVLEGPQGRFAGRAGPGLKPGAKARLYVRPEALSPSREIGENRLKLAIERFDFEGAFATAYAVLQGTGSPQRMSLTISQQGLSDAPAIGAPFTAGFSAEDAIVLSDD
ncbi:ABC transporter ATP-binding protein [Stappia indica]|uniref:ABC transporter ATP-binding protein n=1 Tax=Stappia indica TaxID=538381 RepID=UPI001CD217CC|nr:ABC transporter ATP-binding protein [Stappia indica]MCA1298085.1 ABC transporter ATP-binding protein [Stappia indica]